MEGILERGDRLVWTGFEGLGKSVTMRQLAIGAAAGIHPFTSDPATPRKVLWIDCENSERQGRRHFRKLERVTVAKGRRVPDGGMRLIHRPEGIDLTQRRGRRVAARARHRAQAGPAVHRPAVPAARRGYQRGARDAPHRHRSWTRPASRPTAR